MKTIRSAGLSVLTHSAECCPTGVVTSTAGTFSITWDAAGIATVTVILDGALDYRETTGNGGVLPIGGVEWMSAGT